jgi:hypothetical protein
LEVKFGEFHSCRSAAAFTIANYSRKALSFAHFSRHLCLIRSVVSGGGLQPPGQPHTLTCQVRLSAAIWPSFASDLYLLLFKKPFFWCPGVRKALLRLFSRYDDSHCTIFAINFFSHSMCVLICVLCHLRSFACLPDCLLAQLAAFLSVL